VHAGEAVTERRQAAAGQLERLRVTVQPDDPDVRERLQHSFGVAAHAERGVHEHGVLDVERRGQQVEAALQQHGGVPGGGVVNRVIGHRCSPPQVAWMWLVGRPSAVRPDPPPTL